MEDEILASLKPQTDEHGPVWKLHPATNDVLLFDHHPLVAIVRTNDDRDMFVSMLATAVGSGFRLSRSGDEVDIERHFIENCIDEMT